MDFWNEAPQSIQPKRKASGGPVIAIIVVAVVVAAMAIFGLVWQQPQTDDGRIMTGSAVRSGSSVTYEHRLNMPVDACGYLLVKDGAITGQVTCSAAAGHMTTTVSDPVTAVPWASVGGRFYTGTSGAPAAAAAPTPTHAPAAQQLPAMTVRQSRLDPVVAVEMQVQLEGLDPQMVYLGGFMISPEGELLENAGDAVRIYGQTQSVMTTVAYLPAEESGKRYQAAYYYYSRTGDTFIISDATVFTVGEAEQLPTFVPTAEPAPTADPFDVFLRPQATDAPDRTPSPFDAFLRPQVTETPLPTRGPSSGMSQIGMAATPTPRPTAQTHQNTGLPTVPSAAQFHLYPAEMRYYYHQLTPNEQMLFTILYDGIANFDRKIDTTAGRFTEDEYKRVLIVLRYDCPELFQFNFESGGSYWQYEGEPWINAMEPTYYIQSPTEFRRIYDDVIGQIEGVGRRSDFGTTDYDHELAIYRDLIARTDYNNVKPHSAFADGPYVYGYAKCSGYAHAFALACRYWGIPTGISHGTTLSNGSADPATHAWNFVYLEGDWYLCDPTWDDPTFGANGPPPQAYQQALKYFNVTDDELYNARFIDEEMLRQFEQPDCTATAASFYSRTMPDVTVRGDWEQGMLARLDGMLASGENYALIRFETESQFAAAAVSTSDVVKKWMRQNSVYGSFSWFTSNDAKLIFIYDFEL